MLYAVTTVNANPTLSGTGVTEVDDAAATTGVFTEPVTGLSGGTGYSFVAFATNSAGTTYTTPVSTFSTPNSAPSVTTPTSASISLTTATLGGDVTATGGVSLTKRGVLYAVTTVNANPQLNGTGVTELDDEATTTGIFTEPVTGLSIGAAILLRGLCHQQYWHHLHHAGLHVHDGDAVCRQQFDADRHRDAGGRSVLDHRRR